LETEIQNLRTSAKRFPNSMGLQRTTSMTLKNTLTKKLLTKLLKQ